MRSIPLIILLLLLTQIIFADDQASPVPDSIRIERLAGLCELWGVVKYFHPYLAYKDIDWDEALIKTIPKVNKAETADDYRRAIQYLITFLQDPNTYVVDEDYEFPRSRISDIPYGGPNAPVVWTDDSIAIIPASDFKRILAFENLNLEGVTAGVFWDNFNIDDSRGLIVDARCLRGPAINMSDTGDAHMKLSRAFKVSLLRTINDTIWEPTVRFRIYSRHLISENPWDWKYSHFLYRNGSAWYPREKFPRSRVPIVFIINEGSAELLPLLGVLQEKNRGAIIYEGPFSRDGGIEIYEVKLPESVAVKVRLTEIVRRDGTEAVHPNIVIPFITDTTLLDCPPIKTAIDIIRGNREIPPGVANTIPLVIPQIYEKSYGDMPAPKMEYRLFALYKLWNEIKYFFPYLDELDQSWYSELKEMIPVFEAAVGGSAYKSAILKTTDKSGGIRAQGLDLSCYSYFAVGYIEDQNVVTDVRMDDTLLSDACVEVGDVVLQIDGEDIDEIRKKLASTISEQTPQSLKRRISKEIFGSRNPSRFRMKVRKADGRVEDYDIARHRSKTACLHQSQYNKMYNCYYHPGQFEKFDGNITFISIRNMGGTHIAKFLETMEESEGLIVDLRGDIIWSDSWPGFRWMYWPTWKRLASVIAVREVVAYLERVIERKMPDPDKYSFAYDEEMLVPDSVYHYQGKVVALIDANTRYPVEELGLYFRAIPDVTFIGMPTEGGSLRYTPINLPGGTLIEYLRRDIRFPDDSPLYGVGIQPDIYVEPTIEGIRQGRDEILEAAIEYLENKLKK